MSSLKGRHRITNNDDVPIMLLPDIDTLPLIEEDNEDRTASTETSDQ